MSYYVSKEIKLLDEILQELINCYPFQPDFEKMKENVIDKLKGRYYEVNNPDTEYTYLTIDQVIKSALRYLNEEKYIEYNVCQDNSIITLNYKGYIKVAGGGFVGEYKSRQRDKVLQRIFWIAAALSLGLSLYVVLNK